jgi:hypothetical protein
MPVVDEILNFLTNDLNIKISEKKKNLFLISFMQILKIEFCGFLK